MHVIEIASVYKRFGARVILDGVDAVFDEGSIVSLTGPSGSGKTTLLGVIAGMLKPDRGTVTYKGRNIFRMGDLRRSRLRNREIGYVFQSFNLISDISAYQNIVYPALINRTARDISQRVRHLIEYLDLGGIIRQYPASLSGGEKQRVAIARAMINRPSVILADEPTGNLDEANGNKIFSLFRDLAREQGVLFIVATHDKNIIQYSDRHFHVENGRCADATPVPVKRHRKATS